jgi:hypothetical protein
MLYSEIIGSEIHKNNRVALYVQHFERLNVRPGGTRSNALDL